MRKILAAPLLAVLCLLCSCTAPATRAEPAAKSYRILVTNDDGIEAAGIAALVAALRPLGEVVVVAPKLNQSGASHSISGLSTPLQVTPVMREGQLFGHAVSGTPTDSVLVALHWLQRERKFDLLVSGINYGTNVGIGTYYSGTVGAAIEGALNGIPSLAFSQDAKLKDDYARSASIAAQIVARTLEQGLAPQTFLNINIPAGELKGIRVAPLGGAYYVLDRFEPLGSADDGSTGLKAKLKIGPDFPAESDSALYAAGYVTISPQQLDWTSRPGLEALGQWSLALPQN